MPAKEWKDRGVIIAQGQFGETHLWIKVLFQRKGLLTVFAFGGSVSRKRFCGCLDILNVIDCRVSSSRSGEYQILQEASLLEAPRRLRRDWHGLGMLNNCLRFLQITGVPEESSSECFSVLLDLAGYLETKSCASWFLPIFFRLRVGSALGYRPDFEYCGGCGARLETGIFLADEGRTYCEHCISAKTFMEKRHASSLDAASLGLLHMAVNETPSRYCLELAASSTLRQCARAIDAFVEYHMGIIWDRGSFQRI